MSLYGNQVTENVNEDTTDYMREFATNESVIPSWVESFSEQSLFLAEFAESEYTKLMESVGIDELAVYESTGSFVVYEGAKFDTLKQKVLKMFEKIGETIKGAYTKVLNYFTTKSDEFKTKVLTKQFGGVKDIDFDKIKSTDKLGKMHTFGDNSKIADFKKVIDDFSSEANAASGLLKRKLEIASGKTSEEYLNPRSKEKMGELVSNIDDIRGTLIKKISGLDSSTVNDMTKELRKKLLGEEVDVTVKWLKDNQKTLLDELTKASSTKREISRAYNYEKKHINLCIKEIKGMKEDHDAKVISKYIQAEKDAISVLHGCYSATMDVFKTRYSEYRNVFARAMRVQKRDVKHESTNLFSETTQEDLVNEAFDW